VSDAFAVVDGRLATGLLDVTDDVTALDSAGLWAVALTFEGEAVCARFERTQAVPAAAAWHGPARDAWRSSLDRAGYLDGVATIREAIADGEVYQVNLCRLVTAPCPDDPDLLALHAALARGNPAPYAAVVHVPGAHVVSASPELFLRRDGARLESRPIKGTGRTADDLGEKDEAENVMIVDLVRNDLARVAETGSVEVPHLCAVEEHPGLVHLVSTVTARLREGLGWADLLAATAPPGSVSGAPKSSALRLIGELEPVPRRVYCGAVGWVDADRRCGVLAVGIRTFEWYDGTLALGTGAGITWGSDAVREWEETELKTERLLAVASS
jgi:para-aminobenzoate synthetase component 1